MSRSRTNILLGTAITSWLVIACTAGTAGGPTFDDNGYERPPNSSERPSVSGHESAPGARDVPGISTDNPGTQGGGGSCPPCDDKFKCTGTFDGKTSSTKIELQTVNGECRVKSKDNDVSVIACGGEILSNGKPAGTWQRNGDGFTATGTGTVTVNGQPTGQTITVTISCTRDSGSSTTTPVPTAVPTATGDIPTRPPTVVDAGVLPPPQG